MRGSRSAAGTISRPTRRSWSSSAVQIRGRDLVDAEVGQLANALEAALAAGPVIAKSSISSRRQPARVLGRRVEVPFVVVVGLRARVDEPGQLLGHAVVGHALHHVADVVRARTRPPSGSPRAPRRGRRRPTCRRRSPPRPRPDRGPPPRRRPGPARSPSATAAGFAPTCGMAMSASAPARRRFLGPVAATAIGTRSPVAQRRRIVAAVVSTSSPASSARTCGTTSANFLVATCFRPSVRTALSPRPRPRITRPGWSCGERRRRARADRVVAGERVRDGDPELDALGRERARGSGRPRRPPRASASRRPRRGRSPPARPSRTDSMKTGKSSGRKWAPIFISGPLSGLGQHGRERRQLGEGLLERVHLAPADADHLDRRSVEMGQSSCRSPPRPRSA